ncbi:MAG: hypothetical protein PHY28_08860 [Dehalococcoidales bacterium]|nr:hypothetical protein [Dehalococcoidales bacterium]
MSKFIERLQQVSRPVPQSMGFKTARTEQSRPKIQLIANISGVRAKSPAKELPAADALIVPIAESTVSKTTYGVWLSNGTAEEVAQSIKSGADFVILPSKGELLPPDKKIGKVLQIEASITDVLLRAASELPIDAVFLSENRENGLALTWNRLMLIQRFSSLLNKPLLIEVLPNVTDAELQLVWETGVSGIIVTVDAEQGEKATQHLRQVIYKLSFPSRRKHEKTVAILPRVESQPEEPEEDEDDDD